jgi:hypothetical protein
MEFIKFKESLFKSGLLFCIAVGAWGCKESTILGTDVSGGVNGIGVLTTDTFTVHTELTRIDSVQTNQTPYRVMLGNIDDDPDLGSVWGGAYLQVVPPKEQFEFTGNQVGVDSVVLAMGYQGVYGDTTGTDNQQFKVYRLNQRMIVDSSYYSTSTFPADRSTNLCVSAPVNLRILKDSVEINGKKEGPQMRLKLSNSLGNDLINAGSAVYLNSSTFLDWFKGLYIEPDTNSGKGMVSLGIIPSSSFLGETRMIVYYHNDTSTGLSAEFRYKNETCRYSNYFSRTYKNEVNNMLANAAGTNDSVMYITTAPGLSTYVTFPYLKNFPVSVINDAELVITQVNNLVSTAYGPCPRIIGYYVDSTGKESEMFDYSEGLNYLGGVLSNVTIGGNNTVQYKLRISREIQKAIAYNAPTYPLKIRITGYDKNSDGYPLYWGGYRVKAGGGGSLSPQTKIKLVVTYNKI